MTQNLLSNYGGPGFQQESPGPSGAVRTVLGAGSSVTLLATDTNVRYVDPGGNDGTGNGSRSAPFRTVAPAIAACTAAGASLANPFAVRVSPGAGYGSFTLAPNVYVIGSGTGSGNYNGTPITGVTFLAPAAAQSLGAGWAGAADKSGGILSAVLTTAFKADFNAIGSTAAVSLLLDDIITDSAIDVIGSGNNEYITARQVYGNAAANFTITNMGGSNCIGCSNDFGGGLNYVGNIAGLQGFHVQAGCLYGGSFINSTGTVPPAGFLIVQIANPPINDMADGLFGDVIGVASVVCAPGATLSRTLTDAAHRLAFGNDAAATVIGANCARNIIKMTPTAARLLTIARPNSNSNSTEIVVQNLGNFPIDLALLISPIAAGSPTYVPPQSQCRIIFDFAQAAGTIIWLVDPIVQAGSVALTNGVSALIPADITARSRIVANLKTFSGAAGVPGCLSADRVVGTRAGGGGFKITSYLLATGAIVATDQGTYDWHVDNQGG